MALWEIKQSGFLSRRFHSIIKRPFWAVGGLDGFCVAAYKPKGALTQNLSYVNLANPGTNDMAAGVAPSWLASTGWVFNGTTQYLLNNLTPTSGWSMFVHYANLLSTGAAIIVGSQNTTGDRRFYLGRAAGGAEIYGNGGIAANGAISGTGVIGFAGEKCYFNGVDEGLTISGWSDPISAQPIFAGALNANGTATTFCSVRIHALAIYNTVLDATKVDLLTKAMQEV